MITLDEINHSRTEFSVDKDQIDSLFDIIENTGKGNCLFYSFSQIFTESESQKKHTELRKQVCDFYKRFDVNREYPSDSIEEKIQMLILADEEEHTKTVCKKEWGTMMDIYTIALIYNVNVVVFMQFRHNPSQYKVMPIQIGAAKTVYLRYNTH